MQSIIYRSMMLATAISSLFLSACINSPLPSGTIGALYQWDDLDTPVVTREGVSSPDNGGYFDGDFDLTDLSLTYPGMWTEDDKPFLMEACDEEQCYSIVLFVSDFGLGIEGKLTGGASMTALSTLLANEVKGLPAYKVRSALDALSAELSSGGVADYAALIRLDPRRRPDSREKLLYATLYDEAVTLHRAQPTATVQTLLGKEVERTADLVVSSEFEFDSSWQLTVDVDLSSRYDAGAYLLLCRDFEFADDGYAVDYSSCPLSAPLQAGAWSGEVKLTGIADELIAVIMPLQNPDDAEYALWQRSVDGETFILR